MPFPDDPEKVTRNMKNSIEIRGSPPEQNAKLLKENPRDITVGELDLFEENYNHRKIRFVNIIFLPFNFQWQIFLCVTIMMKIIVVIYDCVFSQSVHKDLIVYRINNYYQKSFLYFSEIFFWADYILLLVHRNFKRYNVTKAYKEVKTVYFLLTLVTIVNIIVLALENDSVGIEASTNIFFQYLELVLLLRLVRVCLFFSYLINSAYLNIYVCFLLFMSFIAMSCTICASIFYMLVINRKLVPGTIEDQITFTVPMITKGVFSSWPMQTLADVSLMCFYIVTNCFFLRGQATLQNYEPFLANISLFYMCYSLLFTLTMISLFVVTLMELKLEDLMLSFRMELLCLRLKSMNCDRIIIKRIESFYKNRMKQEADCVDSEMKRMLPSSLYRFYTFKTYAPALLRSHLFKKQDPAFLSAISLLMKTEFHFAGHVLFSKGQVKDAFVYLEQGVIQVMSCYNSSTPILSFFPGTCFGESTIVSKCVSTSHVVCATYCQLIVLYKKHFDLLKLDFASHCKFIREEIVQRNKKAQLDYQQRYSNDYSLASGHQECNSLKKIKRYSRVIDKTTNKSASHLSYEDLFFKTTQAQQEIQEYINSDSNYLDMVVVSENTVRTREDISFITQEFPLILHPQSPFITLWNNVLLILVSFYVIFIPLYVISDQSDNPLDLYRNITVIIQSVFLFDLFAQTTFAVFTPEKDLISVKDILFYRLTTAGFLADIVGSVPLNSILKLFLKERKMVYRFFVINHFFRAWRIVKFFNDQFNRVPRLRIFFYTVFSVFLSAMFLWYCSIVLIVLSCENRTTCNPNGMWYKIDIFVYDNKGESKSVFDEDESSLHYIVQMFFVVTRLTFGTSGDKYIPYTREEHLFVLITKTISFFTINFFIAFLMVLVLTMTQSRKDLYEKMIVLVYLSNNYRLDSSLQNRILKRCNLLKQVENSGTHLKGESDFLEIGDASINQDLKLNLWGDSLEKCSIFQNTDRKFMRKIASKLNQIIIQPHEFVCFSGVFCPYMYIIHSGYCQLVDTENGVVKSTKGPGYEFGGLEMLLGIPMLQSVRSMTYCEIIYLDKNDFYAILEEFPDYSDQIQATKNHCMPLVDLPIIEGRDTFKDEGEPKSKSLKYFGYNLVVGSREEKEFFNPIYEAGKGAVFLSHFLMRATILPDGNLIWVMEIIRSVLAFISCIVFPPYQILKATHGDYVDAICAFLNISAYVDIYFRSHVAFYNVDGILVTHPLYTFINYKTNGLPLDLFACFPFEYVLGQLVSGTYRNMLLFNRIFQVHRLFGLLDHVSNSKIDMSLHLRAFKYFLLMIIFINSSTSLWFTLQCQLDSNFNAQRRFYYVSGVKCPGFDWLHETLGKVIEPQRLYLVLSVLASTLLTHVNLISFCENCDNTGWVTILLVYFGLGLGMYVFCKLCALSYLRNKNQHYKQEVTAALTFLSKSDVPKDLNDEFSLFFMTCWEHHRGTTPEVLFRETLNDLLQGDIMFEIYGPCLKLNSVFTSSSNSFIRSVVFESKVKIFNKGAHIINEGFVHGDVYVLVDGVICVGTSNKRTSYLEKGALFGNMYDSAHSQQAVAVSAVTIVETLLIQSTSFHSILKTYPVEKALFEAHRNKYSEVGMKFVPGKVAGTESMMDEIEVVEHGSKSKHVLRGIRFEILKFSIMGTIAFFSMYSIAVFDVSPFMLCILYFFDLIYIVLMFVSCHRPIRTATDQYITNSLAIRMDYIRHPMDFGFDLLTVFPFETVGLFYSSNMYVYLLLRLNRFLQVIRAWQIMYDFTTVNVTQVQIKLQITLLLVKLLIITNAISVIYTANHVIASSDKYNSSGEKFSLFSGAQMMVLASFVKFPHSLRVAHKDFNEIIYVIRICHLCFNPILLAILTGNVVFYIHTYFYSVIQFVNQRRSILRRMQFHKTAGTILDTMKSYLRFLWDDHHGCQVPQILLQTPMPLQQKLCWILYSHHFNEHLLFSGCNTLFLRQLIVHLKAQFLFPGNVAVESGIVDNTMYFVHKGEIDIYERESSQWTCVSKMCAGSCFGIEQGLGRGVAHAHRMVARTSLTLLKLEFHAWSYLLHYYPAVEKKLNKYLADRNVFSNE